jgi:hypothetical protein
MRVACDRNAFVDGALVMPYVGNVTAQAGLEDHLSGWQAEAPTITSLLRP